MTVKLRYRVRYTGQSKFDLTHDRVYEVCGVYEWGFDVLDDAGDINSIASESYELVTDTQALPPIWLYMNDAEKGALLLAHHEGKMIEYYIKQLDNWCVDRSFDTRANPQLRYRVAEPEPKVEVVGIVGRHQEGEWSFGSGKPWKADTHRITFNLIDGKPDLDSIKMEEML